MDSSGFSLIDLKGISEPLTKLIDSVSKGIGAIYEPTQKVRNAKAEAKTMTILAEAETSVKDYISKRAFERINYKEIRRQNNIDSIVKGAATALPEKVSPKPVDEDWIVNFFELCQDIGNMQMKQIWSKLLSGEITKPGTFKHRTLQAVKALTPEEAKIFTTICCFSFQPQENTYVFTSLSHDFFEYIRGNGISAQAETHLKNIGLISHSRIFTTTKKQDTMFYFSKPYNIKQKNRSKDKGAFLEVFPFTEIGNELAPISGATADEGYIKRLIDCGDLIPKT